MNLQLCGSIYTALWSGTAIFGIEGRSSLQQRMNYRPVALARCEVKRSSLLVAIVGHRYGWVPEPDDVKAAALQLPELWWEPGASISRMEIELALALGVPVLAFLRDGSPLCDRSLRNALASTGQLGAWEECVYWADRSRCYVVLRLELGSRSPRDRTI